MLIPLLLLINISPTLSVAKKICLMILYLLLLSDCLLKVFQTSLSYIILPSLRWSKNFYFWLCNLRLLQEKMMKTKYQELVELISKTLLVKAGFFDASTKEKFMVMASITSRIKSIKWSLILLNFLVEMITKQSTWCAVHISKIFTVFEVPMSAA